MKLLATILAVLIALTALSSANADQYSGKIRLVVQSTSCTAGIRFLASSSDTSLFTDGSFANILLQALLHKMPVDVGYKKITCPCNIVGVCGKVQSIALDGRDLP